MTTDSGRAATGRRFPTPISGSYDPADCLFLLKPLAPVFHSIADKECLIQTGRRHYSQMIHRESPPSAAYRDLFLTLTATHGTRLAVEILGLAEAIAERRPDPISLVSFARAGTPIGVLLQRALTRRLGRRSRHYSLSIIRDRGIDTVALDYLLATGRDPRGFAFVDGWTAKGAITREFKGAIAAYRRARRLAMPDELFVVADIGGYADVAATTDDYAIPSGLMNATVSGLVSRSILDDRIGPDDFHGCVLYPELAAHDRSNWFVDEISARFDKIAAVRAPAGRTRSVWVAGPRSVAASAGDGRAAPSRGSAHPRDERRAQVEAFLDRIQAEQGVSDRNRIKPGIAEATRVLLRRVPDLLLLRRRGDADCVHLERLAAEKAVPTVLVADMPFGACALIRDLIDTRPPPFEADAGGGTGAGVDPGAPGPTGGDG